VEVVARVKRSETRVVLQAARIALCFIRATSPEGRCRGAFFFARFFVVLREVLLAAFFAFFAALRPARWAPTAFDECPTAATAAFSLAGVTLNFFDQ
jgi:hypothetical protein